MTRQDMFDRAWNGVFMQGRPAIPPPDREGGCEYLTQTGLRCAIGHILTEEQCRVAAQGGGGVITLMDRVATIDECLGGAKNYLFLMDLQIAHDNVARTETLFIEKFKENMVQVAKDYNLRVPT